MKYAVIAGETSGDLHASRLIAELKKLDPDAQFRIIGGDLMAAETGLEPDLHIREMNVMGFIEVARRLPQIFGQIRLAKRMVAEFRPDHLILVDYPSFNLRIARYAHRLGIRTHYYISPKLWAWKTWRVRTIRRCIDALYCILPFEPDFYKKRGYDRAVYVGNPSVEEIADVMAHISPIKHLLQRAGIDDERPIIALLPGSRQSEIAANLPLMIAAAKRYTDFQYIVAAAPSIPEKFYREVAGEPGLKLMFGCSMQLAKYARAALVTSGTATLETALVGTPQVVCYRANGRKWTYDLMARLLKVKFVSLPNLIVGNRIVPELLLHRCTVEAISRDLVPLLQPSPGREWQLNGYKTMRRKLGTESPSATAAEQIISEI